jgi:hypothetical protein
MLYNLNYKLQNVSSINNYLHQVRCLSRITLEDRRKRLWRWVSLSIGAPLGNLKWGSSTGDFERWMKGTLGMERFSLKRLIAEGLWGGLLYWGPWKIRASLSIGAPLGNLEGISLPELLREKDSISGFLCWPQRALRF